MKLAYLNGKYAALDTLQVSVLDRGFLFADSLYEVMAVYNKVPRAAQAHWARLAQGCAAIGLACPLDFDTFHTIIQRLIDATAEPHCTVYLQITRGVDSSRHHRFSPNLTPTVFAMTQSFKPPTYESLAQGGHAVTVPDIRWKRCDIKTTALLANVLCQQQALAADPEASDAILIQGGFAIEGATSNLFVVQNDTIYTPPLSTELLAGTTRRTVLGLAQKAGIFLVEAPVSVAQLSVADEIWLASTTREILPIVCLDGKPVGTGKAGPLWEKFIRAYQEETA